MGLFDTVKCEYPLSNVRHQGLEFQTKDLDCALDSYTITADGRLVRHARRGRRGPERDVEWPIHGDIRIYTGDPDNERGLIEYSVRFTHGCVEWVCRVDERGGLVADELPVRLSGPALPSTPKGLAPAPCGRRLTVDEFAANSPEKLELVDGGIPGAEKLVLLLLTSLGLRRAVNLVGPDRWIQALDHLADEEPAES